MSELCPSNSVNPERRIKVIKVLNESTKNDILICRDIEAAIHASALSESEYKDKVQQIIHNLTNYPTLIELKDQIVCMTNRQMSKNTLIENIENETRMRRSRFEAMLQDKYLSLIHI